jgi:hypothetical protein
MSANMLTFIEYHRLPDADDSRHVNRVDSDCIQTSNNRFRI